MQIVEVSFSDGEVLNQEWLMRAEQVHRELRPHLPADYPEKMKRVLKEAHMALIVEGDEVLGLAVYRWHEDTFNGVKFYVDDLVTTEKKRSKGVGKALLAHLETNARRVGADGMVLDSGTQRLRAHQFYFREGFVIPAFNFKKKFS